MPMIIIKTFRYAFRGCDVVEYSEGEQDVPDEVATLALAEGWADASDQDSVPAAGRARKTKE